MERQKIQPLDLNHTSTQYSIVYRNTENQRNPLRIPHSSYQSHCYKPLLAGEYRNSYTPVNPACCMPICPPSSSAWPSAGSARRDTSTSRICSSSVSGSHPYTG